MPGQEVFIPNQIIYNGTFTNYSTWGKRRIILRSGVSYGDDLERVKSVAMDEVKKIEELLPEEGIDFYFTAIGDSTYNFMLRYWVQFNSNDDYCKGMNDVIIRIKKRFEQEGISIAYPVTTLDFGVKGGVNLFDKEINIKS
ncbi:mechanosensitive ion channel family protein [Zhouia amylolytica]|uniref:mechanosensitive ion channel family protein n=1 Tax=Zhouia amylolytica TaxID=376730 RepID=UPI0021D342A4|nr:mechanosensitive ion channel family protein [Zhouia amylolytica]